jgi:hypothetical protein
MAVLLTFKRIVLNYIYFMWGIPPFILQDKNLANIYFELPEKRVEL